ncbi:MAG: hypothetical protein ACO4CU_12095 [Ilumatobacteraceae bacterium]
MGHDPIGAAPGFSRRATESERWRSMMPYTLSMAAVWLVIAAMLGLVVGWLMRSVVAQRQIERARANHLEAVELERLRNQISHFDEVAAERDRLLTELEAIRPARWYLAPSDDLTLVPGIIPDVAELCAGIGIRTWEDLATTEVSLLRTMLEDAGPAFALLDPSQWPTEAGRLAANRWVDEADRSG